MTYAPVPPDVVYELAKEKAREKTMAVYEKEDKRRIIDLWNRPSRKSHEFRQLVNEAAEAFLPDGNYTSFEQARIRAIQETVFRKWRGTVAFDIIISALSRLQTVQEGCG